MAFIRVLASPSSNSLPTVFNNRHKLSTSSPVGRLTTDFAAAGPVGILCGRVDDGGGGADDVVGVDGCWLVGVDVADSQDQIHKNVGKIPVKIAKFRKI